MPVGVHVKVTWVVLRSVLCCVRAGNAPVAALPPQQLLNYSRRGRFGDVAASAILTRSPVGL